jgi:hypothetical protein
MGKDQYVKQFTSTTFFQADPLRPKNKPTLRVHSGKIINSLLANCEPLHILSKRCGLWHDVKTRRSRAEFAPGCRYFWESGDFPDKGSTNCP